MLRDEHFYDYSTNIIEEEPGVEPEEGRDPAIFDARQFREHAETIIPALESYLADSSMRGLRLIDPFVLLSTAKDLMTKEHDSIAPLDKEKLKAIVDLYIRTGIQVHSPGFMGRQFSGVIPLSGVIDMVSSIVNQPSSFYEAGQLPNIAEHIIANEFNNFIGYHPDRFTMITTSGGSLANLTALLAARNDKFPGVWTEGLPAMAGQCRPAIAMSAEAHYSISRATGILGIGENQIVRLPVNEAGQIDINQVEPALDAAEKRGLKVFCMVASAGTTATGAFDSIDELSGIAGKKDIWLHIDGAHGASLLLSDELRYKLKGIEKADSLAWDAHKMLFVPSPCSLLFYKEKEKSYGAFQQVASYVFEKEPTVYTAFEGAEKNFECTKRPMIMNLWVLWALHGRALFSSKIEHLCRLTRQAHHVLETEPGFETLHQPESNILCFRYAPPELRIHPVPGFQVEIRNRICKQGQFFISKVDINNEAALRVVFMNHETTVSHFRMLLQAIVKSGRQIINEYKTGL